MNYNYFEEMKEDIKEYLKETNERDFNVLYDNMFIDDSITGNASGSYTFNTYKAEENICHNLELLGEALDEFGGSCDILKDGAEAADVTIRCYLLGESIAAALEEIEDEWEEAHEEREEDEEE